jgi:Zn-dependent peptidase ImmA (M78 family)
VTALLEYLLARQIPKTTVVEMGISQRRVDELYSDIEPTIDEIRKISKAFKVPARDLILPVNRNLGQEVKLRSNFNYTYDDLGFYEACLIENRLQEISSSIRIESNLPFFVDYPRDGNSAEQLSRLFRKSILDIDFYTPIIQLPSIIYNAFSVLTFTFSSRKIDGASFRKDKTAVIAIAERNDIRMLYTLAHEISHLLVDINDHDNPEAWIDEDVFASPESDVRRAEFFANEFAASVLIPAEGLFKEIKAARAHRGGPEQLTAYEIACAARKFGTSFGVAARRCENLGLLDTGGAASLEIALKKQYQSAEKYADRSGIPPRESISWHYPAKDVVQNLDSQFESGALSWIRVHELFNLKII